MRREQRRVHGVREDVIMRRPRQEPVPAPNYSPTASAVEPLAVSSAQDQNQPQAATSSFVESSSSSAFVPAASSPSIPYSGLFGGPSNGNYFSSSSALPPSFSASFESFIASSSSAYYASSSSSASSAYEWSASSSYSAQKSKWTPTAGSTRPVKGLPGQLVKLSLGGEQEGVSIYSVPVRVGHASAGKGKARARDVDSHNTTFAGYAATGTTYTTYQLQVDLGSSDMWIASPDCSTASCSGKITTFDPSDSILSGEKATFNYAVGMVEGEIVWDEISIGGFDVGYQAFVSADLVSNQDLAGGGFSGLLGLALPANSVISQIIPGTTTSDPDGAVFLDNLFGLGPGAPDRRLFSLALERREDVRTKSVLGLGAIDPTLCPDPCRPTNISLVANPQLGLSGFLHWRIPLDGLTAVQFGNPQLGTDPKETTIPLPASKAVSGKTSPIVVLDSGGDAILVGDLTLLNSIYSPFGVTQAADGKYYVPCDSPISLTFTFSGQKYPMHPLDASWMGADGTTTNCIGTLQYQAGLTEGDMVLGSSFLKNVYTIFNYPDPSNGRQWSPTVAMVTLTNASVASQDFYSVRSLRLPLGDVSSESNPLVPGSTSTGVTPSSAQDVASGTRVLSSGLIALCAILGFVAFAASMFCGWYFWYRRKYGKSGSVSYRTAPARSRNRGQSSDISMSSLRSKKAENVARQRSMVDGYSDFEGDSWMGSESASQTQDAEAHLGALGYGDNHDTDDEVDGSAEKGRRHSAKSNQSSVPSSHRRDLSASTADLEIPLAMSPEQEHGPLPPAVAGHHQRESSISTIRRDDSPARITRTVTFDGDVPPPVPYPQPTPEGPPATSTPQSSLGMYGPFPSPTRHPLMRHSDTSSLYSLGPTDFFTLSSGSAVNRPSRDNEPSSRNRDSSNPRSGMRRPSPGHKDGLGLAGGSLREEDEK